jgi:hypothetical protein
MITFAVRSALLASLGAYHRALAVSLGEHTCLGLSGGRTYLDADGAAWQAWSDHRFTLRDAGDAALLLARLAAGTLPEDVVSAEEVAWLQDGTDPAWDAVRSGIRDRVRAELGEPVLPEPDADDPWAAALAAAPHAVAWMGPGLPDGWAALDPPL